MIKKEILEIRKTVKTKNCCIHTVNLCYVGPEKDIIFFSRHSLHTFQEPDIEKYCGIFQKTLAGKPEKNLVTLEFNGENGEERKDILLKAVKESGGKGAAAEALCKEIADSCDIVGNFLIILAFGNYDIPQKTSDGRTLEDASDGVYEYMLCSICPVEPSESGLFYIEDKKEFTGKLRDWIVRKPAAGFLFPSFEDRTTDIHHCLYSMPKPKDPHRPIVEEILGSTLPQEADEQKDLFRSIVSDALGKNATIDNIVTVNRGVSEYEEERTVNEEPAPVDKTELQRILRRTGFQEDIDEEINVMAENIIEDKYVFETNGIRVSVSPEHIDRIEQQMKGGAPYILIPAAGMTLNGIDLKTGEE